MKKHVNTEIYVKVPLLNSAVDQLVQYSTSAILRAYTFNQDIHHGVTLTTTK